jgi:hypothetical protein
MQTSTPTAETETQADARNDVSAIQRAITTPYTDDDISVMTPDMVGQFRGLSPRVSQVTSPERAGSHHRGRSLNSSASTALAVSTMSSISSADSLDRSPNPRNSSYDTPRQVARFEINSVNLSHPPGDDDDDQSVDTLMTATQTLGRSISLFEFLHSNTVDPVEANRMSIRATSQSFARLEAEEREAQRILSRAASNRTR